MQNQERKILSASILKQAVRDIASKDSDLSQEAIEYFNTKDFDSLCESLDIQSDKVRESVHKLFQYPLLSRKKIADRVARIIDSQIVKDN
jgi:predicted transcriptional regulator|tara:strand:- start:4251 stop:4520 length:270 start_codon:yes stop_codon:yes gene_type:complete